MAPHIVSLPIPRLRHHLPLPRLQESRVTADSRSAWAGMRVSLPSFTTMRFVPVCIAVLRAAWAARRMAVDQARRSRSFASWMSLMVVGFLPTPAASALRPCYQRAPKRSPCRLHPAPAHNRYGRLYERATPTSALSEKSPYLCASELTKATFTTTSPTLLPPSLCPLESCPASQGRWSPPHELGPPCDAHPDAA